MKGTWIYWNWKLEKGKVVWNKSWVQDVTQTKRGELLHLTDKESHTNYPQHILKNDIVILKLKDEHI